MKFTGPLSTLLVVLPLLALQVNAAPSLVARGRGGGKGGKGGNNAQSSAAASSSTAAGAAASSTAAGAAESSSAAGAAAASSTASGAAAAGTGAAGNDGLTLNPSVIGPNLANNGLGGNGTEAGQVASLTSTNNFINFCVGKTNTNGQQVQAGSCNSVPMGDIPAKANQPSCKFTSPQNGANAADANAPFTISMAVKGFETGNFVNPNDNYFGAPQQLNGQGQIIGHSHIVVEALQSLTDTTPLDPTKFAFFQGLNAAAVNGQLSANVAKGLPAGAYRVASINTAANHQPVLGPVAQHGSFDDAIYFTVGGAGGAAGAAAGGAAANGTANAGAASSSAADAASSSAAGAAASATDSAAATDSASSTASAATNTASAAAGKGGKGGKGGKKGGKGRRFLLAREN